MRIVLTRDGQVPRIAEPDDFKHFAVMAPGPADAASLEGATGALGRAEGDSHVFVDPDRLRRLPGARPDDAEWSASLDGMLAFAGSQGWIDGAGRVRAHVEWAD